MRYSLTSPGAVMLGTRIPETHRVEGLEYGRHVSLPHRGRSGYYVRPEGTERWAFAYLTPAADEIHETDAETVEAIREEIAGVHEAIRDAAEQGLTSLELGGVEYNWTIRTTEATYDADLEHAAEMLDERLGAIDSEDYDADQERTRRNDALNNAWAEGMTLDEWVGAAARLFGL